MSVWTERELARLNDPSLDPEARTRVIREKMAEMSERFAENQRQNPRYCLPSWVAVHARLLELIPGAAATIRAPYGMSLSGIWKVATEAGLIWESRAIYNPWREDMNGIGTKTWEDYEDEEVIDVLFREFPLTPGPLWFIPDDCFCEGERRFPSGAPYSDEPYRIEAEELRAMLTASRDARVATPSADTVLLWCDSPRIAMIDHEGGIYNLVVS